MIPTLIPTLSILVLVFSVIVHEVAHGLMADRLGDPTARLQGRLTLNPLKHIDPIGSILVPLITYMSAGFAFGWAKPVPYNPYNLKNKRQGELLIALAGPASNLAIALIFGTIMRFSFVGVTTPFIVACTYIVLINLVLAIFNLIPLPPLDGSKLLFSILPIRYNHIRSILESYGHIFTFIAVIFAWKFVSPLVYIVFYWFTGVNI